MNNNHLIQLQPNTTPFLFLEELLSVIPNEKVVNEFYLDEMSCTLQSETSVRGMDASLFDAECSQEGNDFNYRVMFMKNMDKAIYMVVDGWVGEFLRCK